MSQPALVENRILFQMLMKNVGGADYIEYIEIETFYIIDMGMMYKSI